MRAARAVHLNNLQNIRPYDFMFNYLLNVTAGTSIPGHKHWVDCKIIIASLLALGIQLPFHPMSVRWNFDTKAVDKTV